MKIVTLIIFILMLAFGCGVSDYRIQISDNIELVRTSPGNSHLVVNGVLLVESHCGISLAIFNDRLYYSIDIEDVDASNDLFGCVSLTGENIMGNIGRNGINVVAGKDIASALKRPNKYSLTKDFIVK